MSDSENEVNAGEQKWKEFEQRAKKRGVVYLSRIPPFMNAAKVRQLLSPFGEIGRIYLTPEGTSEKN